MRLSVFYVDPLSKSIEFLLVGLGNKTILFDWKMLTSVVIDSSSP